MRSSARAVLVAALFASSPAWAQSDYAAQAEEMMGLSFDLEEVEGRLRDKRAAPHPAAPAAYDPYTGAYVPAPPPPPLAALPLEPNSDVDTVTVFGDRAVVTRVRTVPAPAAGDLEVTFEGLPLGLVASSLEGGVRRGAADIVGVEVSSGVGEVEETERILAVKAEMLERTEELGEIRDRIESLLAQRAYLRAALIAPGRDAPPPSLSQVREALAYVGATEEDIAARLRAEQERATELDEELVPMLAKLDNPLATGMSVTVALGVDAPGDVTVALQYQVSGAWWSPTYNARLDPDSGTVDLEYYGLVTNTTGDVWKDASLLLSTARPAESGELPTMGAWLLGPGGYGYVAGSMTTGPGFYELAAPTTDVAASAGGATVDGSGVVVFEIPGRRTVLGDGSAQRIPVRTQTLPATVSLAAAPKVVPEVYRKARIRYDGSVPLLPGPVSSYVGSDYVGTGAISAVVPGETLDLSFGADDRVKVTRQLVSRNLEYLGIGKNTLRYTFRFRIALTNLSGRPQTVEVLDQLPVSQLEGVVVKTLAVSDGLEPQDDDAPGLLRWRLATDPGQTATAILEFSVTAPAQEAASYLREMELMM